MRSVESRAIYLAERRKLLFLDILLEAQTLVLVSSIGAIG